jgi:hypothetical protein
MNKILNILNKLIDDSVRYHPKQSVYCQTRIDLVLDALDKQTQPDPEGWLLIGDIELEFLKKTNKKIPKNRKPELEYLQINSPLNCLKWKVVKN